MKKQIYVLSRAENGEGGVVLAASTSFESILGFVAEEYGPKVSRDLAEGHDSNKGKWTWTTHINPCDYLLVQELQAI